MSNVRFVKFNQSQDQFIVALSDGFAIFRAQPLELLSHRKFDDGGFGLAEMLFHSNMLVLVGGGPNPKFPKNSVAVWDELERREHSIVEFDNEVRAVALRKDRICVVLQTGLHVLTLAKAPQRLRVVPTHDNPLGVMSLSSHVDAPLVAVPGPGVGQVQVVNVSDDSIAPFVFDAHTTPLACVAFSADASLIATASIKGTLVRIFNSRTGVRGPELRRGTNTSLITCVRFNSDSSLLLVSSDHGTVHVFNLRTEEVQGYLPAFAYGYLPGYFSSNWSIAKFRVPAMCDCVFDREGNGIKAACVDGSFLRANWDPRGQCEVLETRSFTDLLAPQPGPF